MASGNAGDMSVKICTVGYKLNQECHKTSYSRKRGLLPIKRFTEEDRKLLEWRTGMHFGPDDDVCFHHEKLFISRYESLQKHCCDPFKLHKKHIFTTLKTVTREMAEKFSLKPGQKLCQKCEVKFQERLENPLQSSGEEFVHADLSTDKEQMDLSAELLGISPFKNVSRRDKPTYGKRKVKDIQTAVKSKVARALNLPQEELTTSTEDEGCEGCKDLRILLDQLKHKLTHATRREKIKLLTIAPESWTIQKTATEFNVSKYLVRKSRKLKKESGILADPQNYKGRPLDSAIKERVVSFFQKDEYSRMCPGKKDYVSVRIGDNKEQKQKRLLLINLKELHIAYLDSTGDKISFSKFCELRPKWCLPVTASGMHSVCVCQHHQNAKLLSTAVPQVHDYKELLEKMVCDTQSRNCMLHYCDSCPGTEALNQYLMDRFSANDTDPEDVVNFKQWLQTDRTTLVSLQLPLTDFLTQLSKSFEDLREHHYVSKAQSKYLTELKDNLNNDEAIVLLDFSENYSFVIQDAVQGHHWDNSQATLHPFVVYYKLTSDTCIKCLSFCVISDSLKHDTVSVHAFITTLLKHLREITPDMKKIFYFSDGAASQYKNYKNFSNLCLHEHDYGLLAEWHFFATSHGKSPCDGIGGTVKRLVARASLQATIENQILTAEQMFNWARANIEGIHFLFVTDDTIKQNAKLFKLAERFAGAKTVVGTRSHHSFIPISVTKMEMRRVSFDDCFTTVNFQKTIDSDNDDVSGDNTEDTDVNLYQPGKYVACVYDDEWFLGNIVQRSDNEQDVFVNFMKRGKGNSFSWPPEYKRDQCWLPLHHVLCLVDAPLMVHSSGRQYKLTEKDSEKISKLFQDFK